MMVPSQGNGQISIYEAIKGTPFRIAREQSKLIIPLGRGIDGNIKILDLSQERHLVIAGSVLSGKTEFVNSVIASLAMCNRPDEVRLLLDDVTRVELLSFNGLPHLVRPVVTRLEETLEAIDWLNTEISTRYQEMLVANASSIEAYNRKNKKDMMAYLVFVIYELSDLMIGKRDIAEPLICRIAQFGPDAGIHLVVATQRPEPAVLTAAIKASFPTRICFNVVSAEDSRAVLDIDGAERPMENGEMLYLAPGMISPQRLLGCSISDKEIDNIVRSRRS